MKTAKTQQRGHIANDLILGVLVLAVGLSATAPALAQEDDVILNPGTLSGSVSIVGHQITSITVFAKDTDKLYSATTTASAPGAADSIDYVLTVEGDRDYYVVAEAVVSASDYIKTLLPVSGPFRVPIGGDVPLDMSMTPATISGTISTGSNSDTIERYSIYAYVTLPEFDEPGYGRHGSSTYKWSLNVPGDPGVDYTLLVAPGVECDVYTYITVEDLAYDFYDYDTIAPAAGAVLERDYTIDVTAARISGTALLQGIDVTSASVRGTAQSPYRDNTCYIPNVNTGFYSLNVDEGAWRLRPWFDFDLPGDLSDLNGSLQLPYTAAMDIQDGDQLTNVDFIVEPGFIPGTLSLWGANTNFGSAEVTAREYPAYGYSYSDVAPETGEFLFVCSPGTWQTDYRQSLSFDYPDDPDVSLRSTIYQYHSSSDDPQAVDAGEIAPSAELTYGTITVRRYFYVAGGGTLCEPYIRAIRWGELYSRAYGYGSESLTTEGQAIVTLLLPGTYTIEAFADVDGSTTEFGSVDITVDEGDVVVIGGTDRPTIKVTNPTNGEVIYGDTVTVEGTATDDFGIASITVNGEAVAFDPDGDSVHFSHEISLNSGENLITIVVSDVDGTEPVVLTLTVISDTRQRTLNISSGPGGSVTGPGEGDFKYDRGESAPVQAVPDDCYEFSHWTGSAVEAGKVSDPNSADTTVVMDADYALEAHFVLRKVRLTIDSDQHGAVTVPSEDEVTCDCGSSVPIQATADPCYEFSHWTGTAVDAGKVADPNSADTTVTMDADYTLQAHFAVRNVTLSITSGEHGSVTPGEGEFAYDCGALVEVVAEPDPGWEFLRWEGSAVDQGRVEPNETSPHIFVTVDDDYDLKAVFRKLPYTLTLAVTGGGSINPSPGVYSYTSPSVVYVKAVAEPGRHFVGWEGTVKDAGKIISWHEYGAFAVKVMVDGNYTLTAVFE